jgi:glycine/D-amino acid oxidase-like deaminating enzyme
MPAHRAFLGAAAAGALVPHAWAADERSQARFATPEPLEPIRAHAGRIVDIAVCTRPIRAQGPRIEAERMGRQLVIHNDGHGGAGWSLSWGSARAAVALALAARPRQIAVIGCGAIGLTSALMAQRAGLRVRIVTRDRPPEVASLAASGVWSPASRICTEEHADAAFRERWELMARYSFYRFQRLLQKKRMPPSATPLIFALSPAALLDFVLLTSPTSVTLLVRL